MRPIYEANCKAEKQAEAAAVVRLESTIVKLIGIGAADRAAAIRWIAEGEDVGEDMECLCYKLGVPYGYFGQQMIAA